MTTLEQPALRSFDKFLIGGHWVAPSSDDIIEVISPVTEELIATVAAARQADVDAAVTAARQAFDSGPWPRLTPADRAAALVRISEEVAKRLPDMQAAFTADVGAPHAVSEAFHGLATSMWADASTLYKRVEFEERRVWDGGEALIVREPVGVVAVVIPWNGPVGLASLKLGPALAAGCTVVLKLAPEGPLSVLLLAEAIHAAGLPDGVVNVLVADREVSEYLVRHPNIDKVSFTGSTAAGKKIMAICAEQVKRVTLELGGKSAGIILEDADLDEVLPTLLGAGVGHSGQVCAAITRLLVPRSRHDEIVDAVSAVLSSMKVGDPNEADTVIGPLVAERQRDRVESYIALGISEGAQLVTGGGRPKGLGKGWYIEPTLFAHVDNKMRIAQEEIFGPVLVVIPFDDVDDAIRIANDSIYGLSGSVWTKDPVLGERVARQVRTGQIFVNNASMCVTQPFGGFKQSGIGREGGIEGIHEFLETKMIQGV